MLVIFCGNLLMITLERPGQAYKGIFETIADAAQSLQPSPPPMPPAEVPPPSVQLTGDPEAWRRSKRIAEMAPTYANEISAALADRVVKDYRRPQTLEAMGKLLGPATEQRDGANIYYIAGSSDGIVAGRRLVMAYQGGMATDWHIQGDTPYAAPVAAPAAAPVAADPVVPPAPPLPPTAPVAQLPVPETAATPPVGAGPTTPAIADPNWTTIPGVQQVYSLKDRKEEDCRKIFTDSKQQGYTLTGFEFQPDANGKDGKCKVIGSSAGRWDK